MAQLKKRAPFVTTVTVLASAAACGGSVDTAGSENGVGGGSGSGTGGTALTGSGGTAGKEGPGGTGGVLTGGVGGSAGYPAGSGGVGGGNPPPPVCPPGPPRTFAPCAGGFGGCTYSVACQGGPATVSYLCVSGYWQLNPTPCPLEFDSCPDTDLYCVNGQWWRPTGTNPPAPCPPAAPSASTPCYMGGFGGIHQYCGYRCNPPDNHWTVATCIPEDAGHGRWTYADPCRYPDILDAGPADAGSSD